MPKSAPSVRLLSVAVFLAPVATWAQSPFLVSDLHQQESNVNGVEAFDSALLGERLFYAAYDPRFGEEPWVSDGTPEGTGTFLDLCPGPCSSVPRDFTVVGERLYFSADDGVFGREPWVSDGTGEGTRLLRETVRGSAGFTSFTPHYAAVGNKLYFATRGADGVELWVSGGSRRGTRRVATVAEGGTPELHSGTQRRLYFLLRHGYRDYELWTSDGTSEGTRKLIADCDMCSLMGNLEDRLFLRRNDAEHGAEVWVSDGTPDGTRLLVDSCTGSCDGNPLDFLAIDGTGFFSALDDTEPRFSRTLFRSDGTVDGTRPALDSRRDNLIGVFNAVAWRNQVWFTTFDRRFRQGRILMFDPADDTLRAVRSGFVALGCLTATDDQLFFVDARGHGEELWASDGTAEGTERLTPPFESDMLVWTGIRGFVSGASRIFFSGFSQETGWELWTSDGTPAGSTRVVDAGIDPGSASPRRPTRVDEGLIFVADLEDEATGVFTTDGTSAGTVLLDVGAKEPGEIGRLGDRVIYGDSVDDYMYDSGLWISDGTTAGTLRLDDRLSDATGFTQVGDQVFFAAEILGPQLGNELWASDGTPEGTRVVLDINPGTQPSQVLPCCGNSSSPHELTALGSEVLFAAANEVFGSNVELWKSDGTPGGTVMVADILPGPPAAHGAEPSGSHPSDLTLWNGRVFFAATDAEAGRELWVSDGTPEGTERVTDVGLSAAGSEPHDLFVLGDKLYFFARRGRAESLWSTDGTAEGTERVHSLVYRRSIARVVSHRVVGERVFFVAVSEALGPELWVSDGTAAGTSLVVDLRRGRRGSYPGNLTPFGDRVIFAADDGVSGRELWVSDGTAAGTTLLADVLAGPDSSNPSELFVDGPLLYFSAATPGEGRELWAVEHG